MTFLRDPLLTSANSLKHLTGVIVGTGVIAAGGFSALEDISFIDSLYWSVVTMTTTGYGDISPQTTAGKVLAGALMLWSVFFLVPAAVINLLERLKENLHEWTHDEQEELLSDVNIIKNKVLEES